MPRSCGTQREERNPGLALATTSTAGSSPRAIVQNSQVIGSLLASDISFPGVLSSLFDPIAEVLVRLMAAVIKVGHAIQVALNPEGMNLITSAGETAEQTVFHLHLHVVPRWRRDGFDRIWPPEGRFEDADLEDVATRVREACADEKS